MSRSLSKEVISGFTQIEKLNATNWWAWKTRITTLFTLFDYMKYIDGSLLLPDEAPAGAAADVLASATTKIAKWKEEDLHARHLLQTSISDGELIHLQGAASSSDAWRQLREVKEPKGLTAIVNATWKLYDTRCIEGASITEHIANLRKNLQEVTALGEKVPDRQFAVILTKSLPRSWDNWTGT
jgi:hypothetical protein